MRHSTGWAGGEPTNPAGIRSVTVIVTHEDPDLDVALTYGPQEVLADGVNVSLEPMGFMSDWHKVHFELDAIHKADERGEFPWH